MYLFCPYILIFRALCIFASIKHNCTSDGGGGGEAGNFGSLLGDIFGNQEGVGGSLWNKHMSCIFFATMIISEMLKK